MTYQNRYECDDCGFTGNEDEFPEARKLSMRLTPGGAYTDRECPSPDCGALAFPVTVELLRRKAEGQEEEL